MAGPPGIQGLPLKLAFKGTILLLVRDATETSRRLSHASPFLLLLKSHVHSLLGRFPPESSRQIPAWLGVKVLAAGSASTAN